MGHMYEKVIETDTINATGQVTRLSVRASQASPDGSTTLYQVSNLCSVTAYI